MVENISQVDSLLAQVDVLVMAAGTGSRMGLGERKQWLPLCGYPLFVYTLKKLRAYGADSLSVIIHSDDRLRVEASLREANLSDVHVVVGGATRQESVYRGLQGTAREFVAVHDGARPFLTQDDLERVIRLASVRGAATLGAPVRDTIKQVDEGNCIVANVSREQLWAVYTPQVSRRDWLLAAHDQALVDNFVGTDDTVLLERIGHQVAVAHGSPWNVKITEAADLFLMKLWEAAECELD